MKKSALYILLLAVALLPACSREKSPAKPAAVSAAKAVEGSAAPDFTVKDLDGKDVTLSSLKGSVVLVNFWATWCPPCKEEIPSMIRLNQVMAGKAFRMLAISIDEGGKEAIGNFFKGSKELPVYLDTDAKISRLYGTTGVPETFIVDKQGIIRQKIVGGIDWSSPEVISYLDELLKK